MGIGLEFCVQWFGMWAGDWGKSERLNGLIMRTCFALPFFFCLQRKIVPQRMNIMSFTGHNACLSFCLPSSLLLFSPLLFLSPWMMATFFSSTEKEKIFPSDIGACINGLWFGVQRWGVWMVEWNRRVEWGHYANLFATYSFVCHANACILMSKQKSLLGSGMWVVQFSCDS